MRLWGFDRLNGMYFGQVSLLRLPAVKILFENDVDLNELFSCRKLGVRKLDVELAVVLKIGKFLSLMIWIGDAGACAMDVDDDKDSDSDKMTATLLRW